MIFLKLTLANTEIQYSVNFSQVRYYFPYGNQGRTTIVIDTPDGGDEINVNQSAEYIDQQLGLNGRRSKN